jgi:acetyl esterase/lipase
LSPTDAWVETFVVIGLVGGHPSAVELAALRWVCDHVGEFGARRDRMLVAGGARAARLALAARDGGWLALGGQLLVHPVWGAERPMPSDVAGAPPATVVCGPYRDGGRRYAERLRASGVEVREVRDDGCR